MRSSKFVIFALIFVSLAYMANAETDVLQRVKSLLKIESNHDIHAVVMTVAWSFFIDLGIILVAVLRGRKLPFDYRICHSLCMWITFILSSISVYGMFSENMALGKTQFLTGDKFVDAHLILGCLTSILSLGAIIGGVSVFSGAKIPNLKSMHKTAGYFLYTIAKANIILGAYFYGNGKWRTLAIGYVSAVLVLHFIIKKCFEKEEPKVESKKKN